MMSCNGNALDGRSDSAARPRWLNAAGWAFVGLGVVLRLRVFAGGRSLWLDEILVALNLSDRGFVELVRPLGYLQVSPIGFLWVTEAMTRLFGINEYALRILPTACAVAAVPLFYLLLRRLLGLWAAVVGVALFAVSRNLILYSGELKHYGVEAFVAVALAWLTLRVIEAPGDRRRWVALAAAGVVSLLFTFTGIFLLAASGAAVLWVQLRRGGVRAAALPVLMGALWLAAFVPLYFLHKPGAVANRVFHDFWGGGFMPMPPRSLGDVRWFIGAWYGMFDVALEGSEVLAGDRMGMVLSVLFVLGLVVLWRRERAMVLMVTLPVVLTLGASAARLYPFSERLILFLAPLLLLGAAAGAGAVLRGLSARGEGPVAAVVLALALLAVPVAEGAGRLVHAPPREDWRTLFERIGREARPGDAVCATQHADEAWKFYAPRLDLQDHAMIEVRTADRGVDAPVMEQALRPHARVWLIARHDPAAGRGNKHRRLSQMLGLLDGLGERVATYELPGVIGVLYEIDAASARDSEPAGDDRR